MGAYINPKNMTKEQWLAENAIEVEISGDTPELIRQVLLDEKIPYSHLPVVLVDNGAFTAAGIAFSKGELMAFTDKRDMRPKRYFIAPIEKLHEVSPELKFYMEKMKRLRK